MKKANIENTESWEQELRDKLCSHVSEPPAGLWESITYDVQTKERPKPVYHIRRWTITAAMVALVALIGEFAWKKHSGANGAMNKNVASLRIGETGPIASALQPHTSNFCMEHILPIATNKKTANNNEVCARNANDASTITIADDAPATSTIEIVKKTNDGTDEVQETEQSYRSSQKHLADNSHPVNTDMRKHGNGNRSFNVSVSASGLPNEGLSNQSVCVISPDPRTGLFVGSEGMLKDGVLQQDVYEHHYPLKVGLSLAMQLTDHLAVESGINYTYLHSSVTKLGSGQNSPITSSASYLGVPISLSYRIWRRDRLSVYSGIGGEVAKSLQGNQWQVSTMLSARVQYDLNHVCGIYLQPSVDYYFYNHSDVKTYYSEHTLMPSLQVGIRFNIK